MRRYRPHDREDTPARETSFIANRYDTPGVQVQPAQFLFRNLNLNSSPLSSLSSFLFVAVCLAFFAGAAFVKLVAAGLLFAAEDF